MTAVGRPKSIEYDGRTYYFKKGSYGTEFYVYRPNAKKQRLTGDDFDVNADILGARYLHTDVWIGANGPLPENMRVEVIDLKKPHDDLTNLTLLKKGAVSEGRASERNREKQNRQLSRDIMFGYRQICLGCCRTWTFIDSKVYEFRASQPGFLGPCEPKCAQTKALPQYEGGEIPWDDLPHAKFEDEEEEESYKWSHGSDWLGPDWSSRPTQKPRRGGSS